MGDQPLTRAVFDGLVATIKVVMVTLSTANMATTMA